MLRTRSSRRRVKVSEAKAPTPGGWNRRRLARAGVAVLAVGVLTAVAMVCFTERDGGTALAIDDPIPPPLPEPGSARAWEVEIPVSTYSSVHTRHGNLLTGIPIIGWSGRGPDMGMALYHNSANVDSPLDLTAGMGFTLGPGWTVSYSKQIILDPPGAPTTATVIADDGSRDVYTWSDTAWIPPLGVHAELTADPDAQTGPTWKLAFKDQSYDEFVTDADGTRLKKIVDANGNYLQVVYDNDVLDPPRIERIIDGSGRKLEFIYDAALRLEKIKDPRHTSDPAELQDRFWTFDYDPQGRVSMITDPMDYEIEIVYDANDRIASISDKKTFNDPEGGDFYHYQYDSVGHFTLVTDPLLQTQGLDLEAFDPGNDGDGLTRAHFTDRRGNDWFYEYQSADDWSVVFPDGHIRHFATPGVGGNATALHYEHDGDRNLSAVVNGQWNRWEYTYDNRGNMLTTTADPGGLNLLQLWTYDAYNNVTSHTDGAGNTVEFRYNLVEASCLPFGGACGSCSGGTNPGTECAIDGQCNGGTCVLDDSPCKVCLFSGDPCTTDPDCGAEGPCVGGCEVTGLPTLLTEIIEPPAGTPAEVATTTLDYDLEAGSPRCGGPGRPSDCGQIKDVYDPNGVWTGFTYDEWGQKATYAEGEDPGESGAAVYDCQYTTDSAGRMIASQCSPFGQGTWDANNQPTGSTCGTPEEAGASASAPTRPEGFPRIPPWPGLPEHSAESSIPTIPEYGYSPKGELLSMSISGTLADSGGVVESYTRTHTADFDELGRMITSAITSDEWGGLPRGFTYTYSSTTGEFTRTGPDGVETYVALDEANRVAFMRRGPDGLAVMTAQYTYLPNGLLWIATYGNGTRTVYDYDAANRITDIDHQDFMGITMRKLAYTYRDNNLVWTITESDTVGWAATVTFGYDSRGRLTSENRTGASSYRLTYQYDQGGNRTKKIKTLSTYPVDKIETRYHYDVEDPAAYGTDNNRLMFYETWRIRAEAGQNRSSSSGMIEELGGGGGAMRAPPGGQVVETLVSTTYYYYYDWNYDEQANVDYGNVTRVVTKKENPPLGQPQFEATRLVYARNGRTVTYGLGETWDNTPGGNVTDHEVTYVHEYRYDAARQRYLKRKLDPETLEEVESLWTDYDGNQPYGDFTVSGGAATEVRSFQPGIGKVEPWRNWDDANTEYYHGDMIGTTRNKTNASGSETGAAVYTAFGERVSGSMAGPGDRYGYAGAWGYQADEELPFHHVGYRYYDPAIGRFLQRDPIGILGGSNVYTYVGSNPLRFVDPSGLNWIDVVQGVLDVGGFVPVIGIGSDLVNAGISAARGNLADAALSVAAAVPGVGDAAAAAKLLKKLKRLKDIKNARKAKEVGQQLEELYERQRKMRKRGRPDTIQGTGKTKQNDKRDIMDQAQSCMGG